MPRASRNTNDWFHLRRDAETGIESVQAHFEGHAYDAHAHDEILIGVTQQGVQRFRCQRATLTSTRGRVILIEPGAVHDGDAIDEGGFTYAMLYVPQAWLRTTLEERSSAAASAFAGRFRATLCDDERLRDAIVRAFTAIAGAEGRLARDLSLHRMVDHLSGHWDHRASRSASEGDAALRAREYLHAHMASDIGLDELAAEAGVDRFRLHRQFTAAIGQSPHAYLVSLRLRAARERLARGEAPADVASAVGFADQSHLGRWFRRAFGSTPGDYQRACTNVL